MMKKLLPLVLLPLVLAGCNATFGNLTPRQLPRSPNNLYRVEVAFTSHQQTLRWDTIQPQVVVEGEFYPMRRTPPLKNRWEALIPVPAGTNFIHYHYKFGFDYTAFGAPRRDSTTSPVYALRILP